jgi:hypothetical protein
MPPKETEHDLLSSIGRLGVERTAPKIMPATIQAGAIPSNQL